MPFSLKSRGIGRINALFAVVRLVAVRQALILPEFQYYRRKSTRIFSTHTAAILTIMHTESLRAYNGLLKIEYVKFLDIAFILVYIKCNCTLTTMYVMHGQALEKGLRFIQCQRHLSI
jgi:hypothetical protein